MMVTVLVASLFGAPDDQAEPQAIIANAVKKHEAEGLTGFKAARVKARWTTGAMQGLGVTGTLEASFQFPDRSRAITQIISEGKSIAKWTIVCNGAKTWIKENKKETREEPTDKGASSGLGLFTAVRLLLRKDKRVTVSRASPETISGRPAIGVKLKHADGKLITLFFDRKTGLLIKSVTLQRSAEKGVTPLKEIMLFENYQKVQGVLLPHRVTILFGNTVTRFDVSELRLLKDSLPPALFTKP
jgi:hypothetical protein